MNILLRRLCRFLFYPEWHRMDKHKPDFHEPCDIICLAYVWDVQLGQSYECSYMKNVSYEGFVGKKGLFVSCPKSTYWRHAESFDRQYETKWYGTPNMKSFYGIQWGG